MTENDRRSKLQQVVESPATREVIVLAALVALAVSQARTVRDWTAIVHPSWPNWSLWAAAAGYELGIVAVGLALSDEHTSWKLWAGEAILLAVSMAAAYDLTSSHGQPWWRAATAAMLPVQYLVVILAGHFVAVVTERRRRVRPVTAVATDRDKPVEALSIGRPNVALLPGRSRRSAAERAAILSAMTAELGREPTAAELSIRHGVPERTARRWLTEKAA